jgi:predicted permease
MLAPQLDAIQTRLRELPGVESVALSDRLPASGDWGWNGGFEVVGQPRDDQASVEYRFVNPDYFRTFGIALESGRAFDALDGTRSLYPTALLVNRTFAERYIKGSDPLSREIKTFGGPAPMRVIGVVGDVRQAGLDQPANAEVYFPLIKAVKGDLIVALRVKGDALSYAEPLRRALHEVAPDAPVYALRTMDEVTGETLRLRRFNMTLMSVFAALAVTLAAIGLYGVIAYSVARRRREIGLRQAIGANARDIHRLILGSGLRMVVPGLVVGLLGALALGRLISTQLYGIGAADPFVLAGVVCVLAGVAFAACAIPTLHAARVAPLEALRDE